MHAIHDPGHTHGRRERPDRCRQDGIPMSSVYHYFGSKDRILLAVMERGADRFFADLPDLAKAD